MTENELLYVGARYHYWYNQAAIDNNHPWPMICQRAQIDTQTGDVLLHGTAFYIANGHGQVGDPGNMGMNDFPPAPIALVPTIGACTVRPPGSID